MRAFYLLALLLITQAASDTRSSYSSNEELQKYLQQHIQKFNLKNPSSKSKPANLEKPKFYLYNSLQFVQVCYSNASVSGLPYLLRTRSYKPLFQGQADSSVRCYQVFNKLALVEEPEEIYRPSEEVEGSKKLSRENQNLRNEQDLAKWIHNLGQSINKELAKGNKTAKLQFNGLKQFSLSFYLEDKQLQIENSWTEDEKLQKRYKLSKKLQGKGLHQKTFYTIQLPKAKGGKGQPIDDINSEQCEVRILETLPHSTYIDVDELRGYGIGVILEKGHMGDGVSFINVEKPAYESRQYQYELRIPWSAWNETQAHQYQLQVPIHFRYPAPLYKQTKQQPTKRSYKDEYTQIQLHPTTRTTLICSSGQSRREYRVHEDYLLEKGTALIPVGDGQMKSIVNIITLGSEILCGVLLVRQLRK